MKKVILTFLCFLFLGAGSAFAEPPSSLPIWQKTFSTEEGRKSFVKQLENNQALKDGQIIRLKLDSFIYATAKKKGYVLYVSPRYRQSQGAYSIAFWGWNGLLSNGAKGNLPETISLKELFAKHKRTGLYYPMHIGVYADLRRFKSQVSSLKGEATKVKVKQEEVSAFIEVAKLALNKGEFTQAMKDGLNAHMSEYLKSALAEMKQDIFALKTGAEVARVEREEVKNQIDTVATDVSELKKGQQTLSRVTTNLEMQVKMTDSKMKYIVNFGIGAIILILLLFLVSGGWVKSFFVSKADLAKLAKEVKEQGEDLDDLSVINPSHFSFDANVVSESKLKTMTIGASKPLKLISVQDGSIVTLIITKMSDNQVMIEGALRQPGLVEDPLVVDSLANISRIIRRAAKRNCIVGVSLSSIIPQSIIQIGK